MLKDGNKVPLHKNKCSRLIMSRSAIEIGLLRCAMFNAATVNWNNGFKGAHHSGVGLVSFSAALEWDGLYDVCIMEGLCRAMKRK